MLALLILLAQYFTTIWRFL